MKYMPHVLSMEVFVNNTNLTFLSISTKLASQCLKKIK